MYADPLSAGLRPETLSIGALRAAAGAPPAQLWRGDIGEVLVYACRALRTKAPAGPWLHDASSGDETSPEASRLGCTSAADLDRLGAYLARKFSLPWTPAPGEPAAGPDAALAAARGAAGSGAVPVVRAVAPRAAAGGARVTLYGANLGDGGGADGVAVRVGGRACADVRAEAPAGRAVSCVAPAGLAPGRAAVAVAVWGIPEAPGAPPAALRFGAPEVSALAPARVRAGAGARVTVFGRNFVAGGAVEVRVLDENSNGSNDGNGSKGLPCAAVAVLSDEALTCELPPLLHAPRALVTVAPAAEEDAAEAAAPEAGPSGAALEVLGAPSFRGECWAAHGRGAACAACCAPRCQAWELSPAGNRGRRGGAYHAACAAECARICAPGAGAAHASADEDAGAPALLGVRANCSAPARPGAPARPDARAGARALAAKV